ncbi:hypothetical protein [Pseudomonas lopnurensis]|uniref:hypothetical protein n=1 Tax=Pseudomonas lopnurensis TaxID=1477517 RepID=UPI00187A7367|nr:hypothetical protein [Pseudomonas lopnurensis]MBE7377021.1 hypothetical protein [Pseudomonas lopnurensis]
MNTATLWIRAIGTLGFALLLSAGPAWATPVAEALAASPPFPHTRDAADTAGCDAVGGPSVIAFSGSSAQATRNCASPSGNQTTPRPPSYQGRRFAEPTSGAFLGQPIDSRRYSF